MIGSGTLTGVTDQQNGTHPGMAHFAGTGPVGMQCADCCHVERVSGKYPRFRCMMYEQLMKKKGPCIQLYAKACKYFQGKGKRKRWVERQW